MRSVRAFIATGLAVVVGWAAFALVTAQTGKAAYNLTTVHLGGASSGNQTVTLFTVPQGQDLTITDIVYVFSNQTVGGTGYLEEHIQARVQDGGQNPNPTCQGNGRVEDFASFRWASDEIWITFDQFTSFGASYNFLGSNNPELLPADEEKLRVTNGFNQTESHHFQTGLVIPGGNTVDLTTYAGSSQIPLTGLVEVRISGTLQ